MPSSVSRSPTLRFAGQLALTTALGTIATLGYGRRAYAGSCNPVSSVFLCTGPADPAGDVTQSISGSNLVVRTETGFGLDTSTSGGAGFDLTGTGGLTFDGLLPDLSITAADTGLRLVNTGGAVSIDTRGGAVTGQTGDGISVYNTGTSTSVTTGSVSGYQYGLVVRNMSGDLDISAKGTLSGASKPLAARNNGGNTSITVQGSVYGEVLLNQFGAGSLTADFRQATINSPTNGVNFITNTSGDVSVLTGDIISFSQQYRAAVVGAQYGSGKVTIDTRQGLLDELGGLGINIKTYGADLTITTGNVMSTAPGILTFNRGTGATLIDTTGGRINNSIKAYNEGRSTDLRIKTAYVGGGVFAKNTSSGPVVIDTVTGFVNQVDIDNAGGDVSLTTGDVGSTSYPVSYGVREAITVENSGTGDVRIDTSRGIIKSSLHGILVRNAGKSLSITTRDVQGAVIGVYAVDQSGPAAIDTTAGAVIGRSLHGIYVRETGSGVSIRTADVTGGGVDGILVVNNGSGVSEVDSRAGALTGVAAGLRVVQQASAGAVDVSTASVAGGMDGIRILSNSAAAVSVDSRSGTVTGVSDAGVGIDASNVTVRAADVQGGSIGIAVLNKGGALAIDTTAGRVVAGSAGIAASNIAAATDLNIRAGSVTSGPAAFAIEAANLGTGSTRIEVAEGAVVAGGAGAINASHAGSGSFTIANAGELRRLSGDPSALVIDAKSVGAAGGVSLTSTGRITGTISLTDKDDSFVNDGTWNMADGTSDFGGGNDRFENRSNLTFVAAGDGARAETTTLASLESVRNSGTVTLADGGTGDTLVTSGDFDGTGGTVRLDMMADGSAADLLHIMGNVTGGPTRLAINYLGASGGIGATAAPLVKVDGMTKAGDFLLGNPVWDGYVYRLVLGGDNSWSAAPAFSLAQTFAALDRDAEVAQQLLDGQQAGLVNAMAQDCQHFGPTGACISLAGRSTTLGDDEGSSDALVLTAAVQPRDTFWRIGSFLDQRVAGKLPDGFSFEHMGPTLGGFAGYGAADGLGPRLRLSGAWTSARLGIERPDVLGLIEGGEADASFTGWGLGGEVGYGLGVGELDVTPFAGLRRVVSTRGAYAEQGGDADYPLSAEAMSMAQTTLSTGATLQTGLGDAISLEAGFGVEHDVSVARDGFDGSFRDVGSFAIDPGSSWRRTRLFGGAGIDYALDDGIGLSLTASARQLPLDGAVDVTASAGVRAAF